MFIPLPLPGTAGHPKPACESPSSEPASPAETSENEPSLFLGPEHDLSAFTDDGPRYALTAIFYSGERQEVAACNSRVLAIVPLSDGPKEDMQIPGWEVRKLREMVSASGGDTRPISVTRSASSGLLLSLGNVQIEATEVEGRFPRYQDCIPSREAIAKVCLDCRMLKLIVDHAVDVADRRCDRVLLEIDVAEPGDPVVIRAKPDEGTPDGITYIIMPCMKGE